MADDVTAIVDVATGRFLRSAAGVDGVAILRLVVPRNPDETRERYTGDPQNPFRPATGPELAADATAQTDATATADFDNNQKIWAALAGAVFWQITGSAPTAQQAQQMRTKFIMLRKQFG